MSAYRELYFYNNAHEKKLKLVHDTKQLEITVLFYCLTLDLVSLVWAQCTFLLYSSLILHFVLCHIIFTTRNCMQAVDIVHCAHRARCTHCTHCMHVMSLIQWSVCVLIVYHYNIYLHDERIKAWLGRLDFFPYLLQSKIWNFY